MINPVNQPNWTATISPQKMSVSYPTARPFRSGLQAVATYGYSVNQDDQAKISTQMHY